MTHKAEYTRLFTTNTSAKIDTTHAASNNVITAEKVSGGGTLWKSRSCKAWLQERALKGEPG